MSPVFKNVKQIKEEPELDTEATIERVNRTKAEQEMWRESVLSSLKELMTSYVNLQQQSYVAKDKLMYICATGAIFLLDALDVATIQMETYELEEPLVFVKQLQDNVNAENLRKLQQLCDRYAKNVCDFRKHPDVECHNYTIGDLIGMGIRLLNHPEQMEDFRLFK